MIFQFPQLHLIHNILIPYQSHIPHLICTVYTPFGEAGFGKEVVLDILVGKQLAAIYECFQNTETDFLIRPLALPERAVFLSCSARISISA